MTDTIRYYLCVIWLIFSLIVSDYDRLINGYAFDCFVAFSAAFVIAFSLWFGIGIFLIINQAYKNQFKN